MTPKLDPNDPTQKPQPTIPQPEPPSPEEPDIDLNKPFDTDNPTDREDSSKMP